MIALLERATGLVLRDPGFLALLLLVPAAVLWRRRRGDPAVRFGPGALLAGGEAAGASARMPRSLRPALLPVPRILEVLGLVLLVVALARPASREVREDPREGVDVLLVLDASSSMTTNDLGGGRARLDVARDAAAAFVRGRPGDRVGLLTFARYPDLRCPPTLDHEALLRILDGVAPVAGESPEDATGIGTAVARAAQVLSASPLASRVVVLLTDGEENVAVEGTPDEIAPAHAAQLARRLQVRVHAIAAGRGRPDRTGTFVPVDTRAVEELARATGGGFFEAQDAAALRDVFTRIDRMERSAFAEPRYAFADRFLPLLALGIAFLLASRALASTVLQVLP